MNKIAISIITLLIGVCPLFAQTLHLEDAIAIAQDSTIAAHQSKNALQHSQWQYKAFVASNKPQLSFELNPGYQNFTNEPDLHYYKLRNYNMLNTFGELRLEQKSLRLGGNFYARSSMLWTEYFGADAGQRIFSSVPLGVGYSNDLINFNSNKWDKSIQDFHIDSEEKNYRYQLASIAESAERYFIDCLIAESNHKVCKTNALLTKRALEVSKEKFSIVSLSKNELFALELQYVNAQNSLFEAEQTRNNARAALFSFLQIEDNGQELALPDVPSYKTIDLGEAIESARKNNPDYLNGKENVLKAQRNAEKSRAEASLLHTGLDVNLGFQNNSNTFLKSYSNQRFFAYGGITLRIPIYDGGQAQSRKKAAEYNLKCAESQSDEYARQLDLNVRLALNEFNTQQDLLCRTSETISLADDSFALARELFENGDIDISTFTLAMNRKDNAYKNYFNSLKAYWDSWYTLKKLCIEL